MVKVCAKCRTEKSIEYFSRDKYSKNGYHHYCKPCKNSYTASWQRKNKEVRAIYNKEWQNKNPTYSRDKSRERQKKDPVKMNNYKKKWRLKNKSYNNKYKKNRLLIDSLFKLKYYLRSRTYGAFKNRGFKKSAKTAELLGCSFDQLKAHIESKFTEGMSWELLGSRIHIDHIKPLALAKTEDEVRELCHYTNLQPLWAEDNLKKGAKYEGQ